jgi:very-short-patch-repair endonuclease
MCKVTRVNRRLAAALDRGDGVLTRAAALAAAPRWALEHAVRAGQLVRVCPQVYADSWRSTQPEVRYRSALAYAAGRAALSHLSALAVWGLLPEPCPVPAHLMTQPEVRLRSTGTVLVHRRCGFTLGPPQVIVRGGLPVTGLDMSLVDSWPLLSTVQRQALVIDAVGARRTTAERLERVLAAAGRFSGRGDLRRLLDRLAAGCRSPLEIWGFERVFVGPGMPRFARQYPVRAGGRTVYLDVYAERERVDFELDGAAWHGSAAQREHDVRRDAALAAQGILVVRFTHRRLTSDVDGVRRDVLAILATRRS